MFHTQRVSQVGYAVWNCSGRVLAGSAGSAWAGWGIPRSAWAGWGIPGGWGKDWPEAGVEVCRRGDGVDDEQGVGGHAQLWEDGAEDGGDGGSGESPAVDVFGAESAQAVGCLPAAGVELKAGGAVECLQGRRAVFAAEPAAVGAYEGCLKSFVVDAEPDDVVVEECLEARFKGGAVEDEEDGLAAEALALEGVYDVEVPASGSAGANGGIPGGFAAGEPQAEGACSGQGGEAGEFVAQAVVHRRGQR